MKTLYSSSSTTLVPRGLLPRRKNDSCSKQKTFSRVNEVSILIFLHQILVFCCKSIVKTAVIPPHKRLDVYMLACKTSGALQMIRDYDRMSESLHSIRGLDFGISETWSPNDAPRYKGCEPMKQSNHPVKCDWNLIHLLTKYKVFLWNTRQYFHSDLEPDSWNILLTTKTSNICRLIEQL